MANDSLRNRIIRAACDSGTYCKDECQCQVAASIAAASIATACTPAYTAAYLEDFKCCGDSGDCDCRCG